MKLVTKGAHMTALSLALLSLSLTAHAQGVTPGQTEVLGFVGAVSDGGGATFGGGLQYGITARVLLDVEGGYLTGGPDFNGFGVRAGSHGTSVGGAVHYLFPSSTRPKLTPYVLGGIGYVRATASASGFGSNVSLSASSTGLLIGGGGRWQGGEKWGVRPEILILIADSSAVRFSVGVYRRFGK